MKIKSGVSLKNLHVSMRIVRVYVEQVYQSYGHEPVITAGSEGHFLDKVHSMGSYHYFGMALDFRTRFFTDEVSREVADKLQNLLGSKYTVIFEGNHIHIQYNWGKF